MIKVADFRTLNDIYRTFPSEESCIEHLEKLLWDGIPKSPFKVNGKVYYCAHGLYKCRESGKYFTVKTNTVFHNTKIPLVKWFAAIWMLSTTETRITSVNLAKQLDLTQKTAWQMMQKIKGHFGIKLRKPIRIKRTPAEIAPSADTGKLKMSEWLNLLKK